jgi:hypothetical protein
VSKRTRSGRDESASSVAAEVDPFAGDLTPIDVQFADLVDRLARADHDRESARVVRLTAALVSRERGRGHPCVELARWAGTPLAETAAPLRSWTRGSRHSEQARSSARADAPTPLVLDAAGRCYLYRYWNAERAAGRAHPARCRCAPRRRQRASSRCCVSQAVSRTVRHGRRLAGRGGGGRAATTA